VIAADSVKSFRIFIVKMKRQIPKELEDGYWSKSKEERYDIWIKFLTDRLDVTEEVARNTVDYIRELPLHEYHLRLSPRFEAAAQTLHKMSPKCPHHNRSHGAVMVSPYLICRLSGSRSHWQEEEWWKILKIIYGGMDRFLIQQKLSESNPDENNNSIEMFSLHDIKRGVRLPKFTEKSAMRCVSYAYGCGDLVAAKNTLWIYLKKVDLELSKIIQIDFDEAFNLWVEIASRNHKKASLIVKDSCLEFGELSHPTLEYSSRALCKWLRNLGVPSRGEEKHLPPQLVNQSNGIKREFIHGLIATGAYFNHGRLWFSNRSQSILEDYDKLLTDLRIDCSSPRKSKPDTESYCLAIYAGSTKELWEQGYCFLNPYLQSRMDEFYGNANRGVLEKKNNFKKIKIFLQSF